MNTKINNESKIQCILYVIVAFYNSLFLGLKNVFVRVCLSLCVSGWMVSLVCSISPIIYEVLIPARKNICYLREYVLKEEFELDVRKIC